MSNCNRLHLQTLGSQPLMPKKLPDHCPKPGSGTAVVHTKQAHPAYPPPTHPNLQSPSLAFGRRPLTVTVTERNGAGME
jgi:hypothetical protein